MVHVGVVSSAAVEYRAHDGEERSDPVEAARALRDEVKAAVEGITFLHDERDRDPHRGLVPRLRRRLDE